VSKFVEVYTFVVVLNKSRTLHEDTLYKTLDMYIVKQGDNQALTFFHCWFMFRKVP
jgi:hypothetical protein